MRVMAAIPTSISFSDAIDHDLKRMVVEELN
jgi:hypothetical protein